MVSAPGRDFLDQALGQEGDEGFPGNSWFLLSREFNDAILTLCGGGQQNKLRIGKLPRYHIGISYRFATASRAGTTEAPHWRSSRRGRIPGGPKALRHTATLTLCSRRKASHFWGVLLLVCGTPEHRASDIPLSGSPRLPRKSELEHAKTSIAIPDLIPRCGGSSPAAPAGESGLCASICRCAGARSITRSLVMAFRERHPRTHRS